MGPPSLVLPLLQFNPLHVYSLHHGCMWDCILWLTPFICFIPKLIKASQYRSHRIEYVAFLTTPHGFLPMTAAHTLIVWGKVSLFTFAQQVLTLVPLITLSVLVAIQLPTGPCTPLLQHSCPIILNPILLFSTQWLGPGRRKLQVCPFPVMNATPKQSPMKTLYINLRAS